MEGFRYIWNEPTLKAILLMMFIIGTFAYEFPVVYPLFATAVLHGNAATYSEMMTASGIGAIIGGLFTAGRPQGGGTQLFWTALLFGVSILFASIMPGILLELVVLVIVGIFSVLFVTLGNSMLQLTSEPSMRGRVMALWSVAFLGTPPLGGPIVGFISERANPRIGLAVGGLSAVFAAYLGAAVRRKSKARQMAAESDLPVID